MNEEPRNHMKPWSLEDRQAVAGDYAGGASIPELAEKYGRTYEGIRAKLAGFARYFPGTYKLPDRLPQHVIDRLAPIRERRLARNQQQPTLNDKEQTMKITIEDKKLVNGVDVKDMSEDDMFSLISKAEAEVQRLSAIEHKPKVLVARIDALKKGINDLVQLCDERFGG